MRGLKHIQSIFERHKRELRQRFKVKDIGIFGSYVNNKQRKKSDLDILVEFEEDKETFDNYMELKFFLEELLNIKVDLVIKDALREEIKEDILAEVIYV